MSPTESEPILSAQQPGLGLRQAREAAGISLAEVADQTLIALYRLKALERDDYDAAGGATYVKGYVRAYARMLKLDPTETVRLFERQLEPAARPAPEEPTGRPPDDPKLNHPADPVNFIRQYKRGVIGIGVLVLTAVLLLIFGGDDNPPGERAAPPAMHGDPAAPVPSERRPQGPTVPDTEPQQPQPAVPRDPEDAGSGNARLADDDPLPNAAGAAAPASSSPTVRPDTSISSQSALSAPSVPASQAATNTTRTLEFHFTDACWLEVVDANGERIIAREAQSGDNLRLSGSAPFNVVLGNAPAASIAIDGEPVVFKPRASTNVMRLNLGGDS